MIISPQQPELFDPTKSLIEAAPAEGAHFPATEGDGEVTCRHGRSEDKAEGMEASICLRCGRGHGGGLWPVLLASDPNPLSVSATTAGLWRPASLLDSQTMQPAQGSVLIHSHNLLLACTPGSSQPGPPCGFRRPASEASSWKGLIHASTFLGFRVRAPGCTSRQSCRGLTSSSTFPRGINTNSSTHSLGFRRH